MVVHLLYISIDNNHIGVIFYISLNSDVLFCLSPIKILQPIVLTCLYGFFLTIPVRWEVLKYNFEFAVLVVAW